MPGTSAEAGTSRSPAAPRAKPLIWRPFLLARRMHLRKRPKCRMTEGPRRGHPMETPTYVALSRQTALLRQMDVVANNLANLVTPGFKAEMEIFTTYPIRSQTFGARESIQ